MKFCTPPVILKTSVFRLHIDFKYTHNPYCEESLCDDGDKTNIIIQYDNLYHNMFSPNKKHDNYNFMRIIHYDRFFLPHK